MVLGTLVFLKTSESYLKVGSMSEQIKEDSSILNNHIKDYIFDQVQSFKNIFEISYDFLGFKWSTNMWLFRYIFDLFFWFGVIFYAHTLYGQDNCDGMHSVDNTFC